MLNVRIKAFIIITKVLIVHNPFYHGYRKKKQPNSSIPKDSRLSRLCRGVQLYPHGEMGWTSISHAPDIRVASRLQPFPNPAQVFYERFERLPGQCPEHSRPMPTPLPVSWINRSQLVTWLVDPIRGLYGWLLGLTYPNTRSLLLHELRRLRSRTHHDLPLA